MMMMNAFHKRMHTYQLEHNQFILSQCIEPHRISIYLIIVVGV